MTIVRLLQVLCFINSAINLGIIIQYQVLPCTYWPTQVAFQKCMMFNSIIMHISVENICINYKQPLICQLWKPMQTNWLFENWGLNKYNIISHCIIYWTPLWEHKYWSFASQCGHQLTQNCHTSCKLLGQMSDLCILWLAEKEVNPQ